MTRRVALTLSCFLLAAIGGAWSAQAPVPEEDLAAELKRLPPVEPADALKTFRLHEGFRIEPVAVEPLVTDPVSVCYDEDGRLYVVEMRGYPYPEDVPPGRVRRLEDTDGDGIYDRGTTFLDDLSWPTSIVPYDGGVYIAAAPNILYAKDNDGDGVADQKRVVFTGFGTQNVQALLNGLLWGPDGWIYGVSGGNGGTITSPERPEMAAVELRRRDFRFRPDASAFEPVSGGGQFGHSFDDRGRRFTSNNSNHIRQIVLPADAVDRNPHYSPPAVLTDIGVEGAAAPVFRISPTEPWRIVRTRRRAADPAFQKRLPPTELVASGFFTSATGVTIYRGTAYPPEYRGNAFVGDVGGNLIHRKYFEPNGSILKAIRADQGVEFLASTDTWFRPVNYANTPSGTLLVLDMYRETIEHPASIPEDIKAHLDLTSGHDRGRLYEIVPDEGFTRRDRPALSRATTAELVALLADPDAWWRETAQRLLIERHAEDAAEGLRALLVNREEPETGRRHALWTLGALEQLSVNDLLAARDDPDPGVREHVARLATGLEDPEGKLVQMVASMAGDADPSVRLAVALALGAFQGPEVAGALAVIAFDQPVDSWTRAAVLCSSSGHAAGMLEQLVGMDAQARKRGLAWVEDLASLAAAESGPESIRALLKSLGTRAEDFDFNARLLVGLGRGLERAGSSLEAVAGTEIRAVLEPLFAHAAELAAGAGDPEGRVQAIRLLGLGPIEPALEILPARLDAREPAAVQLAALQALAGQEDPRVGPAVAAAWRALSPALRSEAAEVLLARPDRAAALLDAVEEGTLPPAEIEPARRAQLLAYKGGSIQERAQKLLGDTSRADRAPVIAQFRSALERPGDPDAGRAVFKEVCATCHKAEGVGIDVGPDLATVTNRTPEDLLIHILDPNREVQPAYVNYTLATADGRVLSGMIAAESAGSVTLRRAEGATDVVPRDQIDILSSTGLSLMPENLETLLDPDKMADLLAYLLQLRGTAGGD